MKQIANTYTFDASAGIVTVLGLSVPQSRLLLVVNATRNEIIYNFAGGPGTSEYTISDGNTVLTLAADTSTHSDADSLTIFYDDGLSREESLTITDLQTVRGSNPAPWLSQSSVPVRANSSFLQVSRFISTTQSIASGHVVATLDAGQARRYILLQNQSTLPIDVLFVGSDDEIPSDSADYSQIRIPAGGALCFEGLFVPQNRILIFPTAAGQQFIAAIND
jgi:hypothetical protein